MIFHITTGSQWSRASEAGSYEAESLAIEGFIHCSEEHQVARVANERFPGHEDLVVLHIAEGRLDAPVKRENLEGGSELFPHVYGPLPVNAVVKVSVFEPGPDGDFAFSVRS